MPQVSASLGLLLVTSLCHFDFDIDFNPGRGSLLFVVLPCVV